MRVMRDELLAAWERPDEDTATVVGQAVGVKSDLEAGVTERFLVLLLSEQRD